MGERGGDIQLSVIVPVGSRFADLTELHLEYQQGLASVDMPCEFIYILDGPREQAAAGLARLLEQAEHLTIVKLTRSFGEATALMAGLERARGEIVVTLPAYHQIEGTEIAKLVAGLDSADLVIGHRWPRAGGPLEALRRWAFHGLLAWVTRVRFHDLGCSARAMKRSVLEEIHPYGDQHRFLAVLANRLGFRVREIEVRQSPRDRFTGVHRAREYARSVLDIFTVFFLVRFTKRPLRFFGMIGVTTFAAGALVILALVVQRLFFGQALATRPALLLASLLVVLGLQLFALGLLGELIIFTHARNLKDYQVESVIQFPQKHGRFQSGAPDDRSAAG